MTTIKESSDSTTSKNPFEETIPVSQEMLKYAFDSIRTSKDFIRNSIGPYMAQKGIAETKNFKNSSALVEYIETISTLPLLNSSAMYLYDCYISRYSGVPSLNVIAALLKLPYYNKKEKSKVFLTILKELGTNYSYHDFVTFLKDIAASDNVDFRNVLLECAKEGNHEAFETIFTMVDIDLKRYVSKFNIYFQKYPDLKKVAEELNIGDPKQLKKSSIFLHAKNLDLVKFIKLFNSNKELFTSSEYIRFIKGPFNAALLSSSCPFSVTSDARKRYDTLSSKVSRFDYLDPIVYKTSAAAYSTSSADSIDKLSHLLNLDIIDDKHKLKTLQGFKELSSYYSTTNLTILIKLILDSIPISNLKALVPKLFDVSPEITDLTTFNSWENRQPRACQIIINHVILERLYYDSSTSKKEFYDLVNKESVQKQISVISSTSYYSKAGLQELPSALELYKNI